MIASMVNNKGGVGKTISSVNLCAALANRKQRVLLIDMDPQCNATSLLLGDTEPKNSLYELLVDKVPVSRCIYPTSFGVDILPNVQITSQIESDLYSDTAASYRMIKDMVRNYVLEQYDIAIIDCPPSLGLWVIMALAASDGVIIPIEAGSRFSLDGLATIFTTIDNISLSKITHNQLFHKILINKVDLRTSSSRGAIDKIRELYPASVFATTIPINDAIKQAETFGTTVLRHDIRSSGARRFRMLAEEFAEFVNNYTDQLELPHG